jgi:hypothetical protein
VHTLLSFFYGFEKQGLATADLMLVLAKQGRTLRSEIILNVVNGGDCGESGFCSETIM